MVKINANERLHDDDIMPFGKHKGERLGDLPDNWFLWFLRQPWCDKHPKLVEYANCIDRDE